MSGLLNLTCGFLLVLGLGIGAGGCCVDSDEATFLQECGNSTVVAPEEPVNRAPRPSGAIPPQIIGIAQSISLNVSRYFQDPDGDALSYGVRSLQDTILGYQAVVGVDYMVSDNASIGVKGRWVKYADFSDSNEWDQLRSHGSDNGRGTNVVVYTIETEDLGAFGVTLVMKYAF